VLFSCIRCIPHEHIMRSIEINREKVLPKFSRGDSRRHHSCEPDASLVDKGKSMTLDCSTKFNARARTINFMYDIYHQAPSSDSRR